jgi:hypothetical protein
MNATVYPALDDECSFEEYPDGLRIEVFLSAEARDAFISSQGNFGDWQTRDVEVRA